jgi:hypothetical protein
MAFEFVRPKPKINIHHSLILNPPREIDDSKVYSAKCSCGWTSAYVVDKKEVKNAVAFFNELHNIKPVVFENTADFYSSYIT